MNLLIEHIQNPEKKYWIWKEKINSYSNVRIYPSFNDEFSSGESVAVFDISDGNKNQIAQLAIPDYDKLKLAYAEGNHVILNYMYIENFEWLGSQKPYEVDGTPYRLFCCLQSEASIWNAIGKDDYIHIMYLEVQKEDVSFCYSGFNSIKLDIENIQIDNGNLMFDYAQFYDSDIDGFVIEPFGNRLFPAEVSFRYSIGKRNNLRFDFLKHNCAIDFLDAKLESSAVCIDLLDNGASTLDLVKAQIETVSISNGSLKSVDIREATLDEMSFHRIRFEGESTIEACIKKLRIEDSVITDVMKMECAQLVEMSLDYSIIIGKVFFTDFKKFLRAIKNHLLNATQDNVYQLLVLKENFRQIGEYKNEDLCHLEFYRCSNKCDKNIVRKIFRSLVDFSCGYGIKPFRMLISIVIVIFLFSIGFYTISSIHFNNVNSYLDCLYVSGITFFTVGYGDIVPITQATKLAVIIEAFLGVSMMSAFLVLLTRKVIR